MISHLENSLYHIFRAFREISSRISLAGRLLEFEELEQMALSLFAKFRLNVVYVAPLLNFTKSWQLGRKFFHRHEFVEISWEFFRISRHHR